MSRIGKKPITIPNGVEVKVSGNLVSVKGPKGQLSREIHKDMIVNVANNVITVERPTDSNLHRSLHGLTRSLIANMIEGVTNGYKKTLEMVGVGYKAAKQGNKLVINVGYSHPIEVPEENGITFTVPKPTIIEVNGINKEVVGQVAANIRSFREPEPYKGKGIKYSGEVIRRKLGKAGKKK